MAANSEPTKPGGLPPSLVANLQNVLLARNPPPAAAEEGEGEETVEASSSEDPVAELEAPGSKKPVVLVSNADGIRSPGLLFLVEALVGNGQCDVYVCAPDSEKSLCGHAITVNETVAATSVEIAGAKAFEISGTPVDCVSLALSGALFPWSKPSMLIIGVNKETSCGHQHLYSAASAAAREALLFNVPSLAISLNWKKDGGEESDFKDAVHVCMPLISAAIRDIEKDLFPGGVFLNIGIPSSPSANKGFKLARHSSWCSHRSWQAISGKRHPTSSQFMSMQQSLGIQLAQLGRDASAAGAARRISTHKQNVVVESVSAPGKPEAYEVVKKFFRSEFVVKGNEDLDDDSDLRVLEAGFICVTPLPLPINTEIQNSVSEWLASAITERQESEAT